MEIIVSHMSGLDFWRKLYPQTRAPEPAPTYCDPYDLAAKDDDVWSKAPPWVTHQFLKPENGVLHTLVLSSSARRKCATHQAHAWTAAIPPESLYDFGNGVYICSPGFLFLQMATQLPLPQLIALAHELCGLYSFDMASERGLRKRQVPLVAKRDLERYIVNARALGIKGSALAQKALSYTLERSASPMETACAMFLTLPVRMGGYALPRPFLNFKIPLEGTAKLLCPSNNCYGDLCWPKQSLAIEYLGDHDHTGQQAVHADRGRTDALLAMGFSVVELTSRQVYDLRSFEAIAQLASSHLSKYLRKESLGPLPSRTDLRKLVFEWNDASGRKSPRL